jgi:hypothetical protein
MTYLVTCDGDRTEERLGPWLRIVERVRLEPYDDVARQTFRRADAGHSRAARPRGESAELLAVFDGVGVASAIFDC